MLLDLIALAYLNGDAGRFLAVQYFVCDYMHYSYSLLFNFPENTFLAPNFLRKKGFTEIFFEDPIQVFKGIDIIKVSYDY